MIGIKFVDIDDKISDVQTWMNLAFSIANVLVEQDKESKDLTDDEKEDLAIELLMKALFVNVTDPLLDMIITKKFKNASDRFFEKENVK